MVNAENIGDARGLRTIPCISTPATARAHRQTVPAASAAVGTPSIHNMLASGLPVGQQRAPRHGDHSIWSDNSAQPARARVMKITSAFSSSPPHKPDKARAANQRQPAPAGRSPGKASARASTSASASAWPPAACSLAVRCADRSLPEARQMWHQQTDKRHRTCHVTHAPTRSSTNILMTKRSLVGSLPAYGRCCR